MNYAASDSPWLNHRHESADADRSLKSQQSLLHMAELPMPKDAAELGIPKHDAQPVAMPQNSTTCASTVSALVSRLADLEGGECRDHVQGVRKPLVSGLGILLVCHPPLLALLPLARAQAPKKACARITGKQRLWQNCSWLKLLTTNSMAALQI